MPKLSDTQAIILAAAARRADGDLLPLPGSLRGGAASKVVGALLSRGFVEEVVIDDTRSADSALNTLWRNLDDGRGVLLRITAAGLDSIGVERVTALGVTEGHVTAAALEPDSAPEGGSTAVPAEGESQSPATVQESPAPRPEAQTGKTREGTKQAQLIAMLKRPEGRNNRADRRGDRLAAAHGARRVRRRAEEEARHHRHLREGRGRERVYRLD